MIGAIDSDPTTKVVAGDARRTPYVSSASAQQ
jgi:hypothetical protein